MAVDEFDRVFAELKQLLTPYEEKLVKVHDEPARYYLDTAHVMKNGKPLFFASVARGKRYVSYYLMPVYVHPGLLEGMSAGLRRRMQGKSCFNFTRVEPELFAELGALTQAGWQSYREAGYLD